MCCLRNWKLLCRIINIQRTRIRHFEVYLIFIAHIQVIQTAMSFAYRKVNIPIINNNKAVVKQLFTKVVLQEKVE